MQVTTRTGVYSAETLRDLSKISEINQKIFRQQTPRAMLNTAVSEVGSHLRVTRCIAVVGAPGRPPEMSAEFCSQTSKPAPGAQVVLLLAQMEKAEPDELGGLDKAVELIRKKAGIAANEKITLVPFPQKRSLFDVLLSTRSDDNAALTAKLRTLLGAFPAAAFEQGGFLQVMPYTVKVY